MRVLTVLTVACVAAVAPTALLGEGSQPAPRLDWILPGTEGGFRVPLSRTAPDGPPEAILTAAPWHKQLPDLEVKLLDGGSLRLDDTRGSVLALSFWATWCMPCRRELPRLQAAYEAHREEGLRLVAINYEESLPLVRSFVQDMGLTMPIGLFDPAMRPTLIGKVVPSLVLADRQGNLRGRWDGFEPSYEAEIDGLIAALLAADREPPNEVASVLHGAGRFELEWFRETKSRIDDVVVTPGESPSILVSHGVLISSHGADGSTDRQWVASRSAGRVRLAPPDDPRGWMLASFRPGGKDIVILPVEAGDPLDVGLDQPVFDVTWLSGSARDRGRALAAGTLGGLVLLDDEGQVTGHPDGFESVVAVAEDRTDGTLLVLESGGRLSWLDADLHVLRRAETPPDPWQLIVAETGGVGVASGAAVATARGRFDGTAPAIAVATREGRLLIVSEADGQVLFEAAWPEISGLSAGDVDGDGADELVVSAGSWFGLLRSAAAEGSRDVRVDSRQPSRTAGDPPR